jgi:4-amino-4-deoxy-L-arabinose transferase-like glycosyltransferase
VNATRIACCVLGGVGIVMVGLLANEVAGRRAALLAAGIAAVYPVWWLTDGLVLSEVLYVPLVAGLLLVAYRLWRQPRTRDAVLIGVLGGLAGLTRSEGLLLLVLTAGSVLFLNSTLRVSRRFALFGVALLSAAVLVAPWVGFNLARFDKPVYLSTNDGQTIADTNCPATYSGRHIGGYIFQCHTPKVSTAGDESDVSARLARVGLKYARRHAGRVPMVVAARVGRTWGVFNPVRTIDVDSFGKWSHSDSLLMLLTYYVIAVLGVAGMVILHRRRVTIIPFVAAIVSVTITVAAFYGIIRFRMPGDVTFVVLAAVALDALLVRLSGRGPTRAPAATDDSRAAVGAARS